MGVTVAGGHVYVADFAAGIAIFRDCAPIFNDDFETGDTSRWSEVAAP